LLLACAIASCLEGCFSIPKPETGGVLSVGRPQVFTRERIVTERTGEVNWLRGQLDKEVTTGFQGVQDRRSAEATVFQLNLALDVLQGRIDSARKRNTEESVSRQAQIERAQHEIDMEKLRQQLEDVRGRVKAENGKETDQSLKTEITKLQGQVKELSDKVDKLTKPAPSSTLPARGDASKLLGANENRTLDPAGALTTRAELTSIQRFEDQAAYRDMVNARIREKILDDSHDLNGSALYELKFDVTFAPGNNTRRFMIAKLKVEDSFKNNDKEKDLAFVDHPDFVPQLRSVLEQEVNLYNLRLQERAGAGALSENWRRRILSVFGAQEGVALLENCGVKGLAPRALDSQQKRKLTSSEQNDLSCLVAGFVKIRLGEPLNYAFVSKIVPVPDSNGRTFYRVQFESKPDAVNELKRRLRQIHGDQPPRVATVEPKEYVQNISDVASRNEATQFGLMLDLLTTKGLAIGSSFERFTQDQQLLHAVKRQPLAVSFLHGTDTFGWILGPKFAIDEKQRATFVHTPSRYTFTGSITVPSWFASVTIKGQGCWLDPSGAEKDCFDLFKGEADGINVSLPSTRYRGLVPALLYREYELMREPEIYALAEQHLGGTLSLRAVPEQCLGVTSRACAQTVVIEGRELWRNPEVYVGNQKADTVEVLPSMRGVAATFRSLRMPPPQPDGRRTSQDLIVVTSVGTDRLPGAVTILPEAVTAPKPFMRLRNAYVDKVGNKATLEFVFEPAALPASFHSMLARVRLPGAKDWKDLGAPARMSNGVVVFEFDPAAVGLGDKAVEMEADVGLKFNPEDTLHSMLDPSARFFTYFPNPDERAVLASDTSELDFSKSATLGAKEQGQFAKRLTYKLPKDEKLFNAAYPGLVAALDGRGGNARLVLTGGNVSAPFDAARSSGQKGTIVFPSSASTARLAPGVVPRDEETASYDILLEYRIGAGEWIPVPIKDGKTVSIKGLKKAEKPAPKPVAAAPVN